MLTDSRDGQTYKTVIIGSQTWMAENLNYESINSFCYDDDVGNCSKYGRLYTWSAAIDSVGTWGDNGKGCGYESTCSLIEPVRGVCPSGWHLPSADEWESLFAATGDELIAGTKLRSKSGWELDGNGTDDFGFSAFPAGQRDGTYYVGEGYDADFWSSTGYEETAFRMCLSFDDMFVGHHPTNIALSVRCLKD